MKSAFFPLPLLVAILLASGCATAVMSGAADGDHDQPGALRDAKITREVRTLLYRDPRLGDQRIHVSTQHGMVSLSGQLESSRDISRAVELAASVDGVRGVNSKIEVTRIP